MDMDMRNEVKALLREVFGLQGIKTSLIEIFSGWFDYFLTIAPVLIFFGAFLSATLTGYFVVLKIGRVETETGFYLGLVALLILLCYLADLLLAFKKKFWNNFKRNLFQEKLMEAVKNGFRF